MCLVNFKERGYGLLHPTPILTFTATSVARLVTSRALAWKALGHLHGNGMGDVLLDDLFFFA